MRMVFAAILFAACASPPDTVPAANLPDPPIAGEAVSVVDGDTLTVATEDGAVMVRLSATNAPDLGECFHDEASQHLTTKVNGRSVSLQVVGTDPYDRALAHVFVDDRHVNLDMVADGLALVVVPIDGDPHLAAMLSAEDEAFEEGTGLWAPEACGSATDPPLVAIDPGASQPDPPGPDHSRLHEEVITIVNEHESPVDLGGWVLRDTSSRHRYPFAEGLVVAPGETVAVRSDDSRWDPGNSAVWNNQGDMALLLTPSGTVVARWRY